MASEQRETQTQSAPSTRQDEGPTPLRRVGQVGLSIINPFSDLMVIYRTGIKPVGNKLGVLGALLKSDPQAQESLTWAQAVACSGRTVDQLLNSFRRKRFFWWVFMMWTSAVALILMLMILAASELPHQVTLRAAVTVGVLAMISIASAAKVVGANYRLWQLVMQRVSLDEGGTFQHYQAEQQMWLQVVTKSTPF